MTQDDESSIQILIEKLRDASLPDQNGCRLFTADLTRKAAFALTVFQSHITTLEAERDKLAEVLRPFADAATFFSQRFLDDDPVVDMSRPGEAIRINVGDLRNAHAARKATSSTDAMPGLRISTGDLQSLIDELEEFGFEHAGLAWKKSDYTLVIRALRIILILANTPSDEWLSKAEIHSELANLSPTPQTETRREG